MQLRGAVQCVVMGGNVWLSSWLSDQVVWVAKYVVLVVGLNVVAVAEGEADCEVETTVSEGAEADAPVETTEEAMDSSSDDMTTLDRRRQIPNEIRPSLQLDHTRKNEVLARLRSSLHKIKIRECCPSRHAAKV